MLTFFSIPAKWPHQSQSFISKPPLLSSSALCVGTPSKNLPSTIAKKAISCAAHVATASKAGASNAQFVAPDYQKPETSLWSSCWKLSPGSNAGTGGVLLPELTDNWLTSMKKVWSQMPLLRTTHLLKTSKTRFFKLPTAGAIKK